MSNSEQIHDVNRLVLLDRSAALEAAGLGEYKNGVIYIGKHVVEAINLFNSLPPVSLPQYEYSSEELNITDTRGDQ